MEELLLKIKEQVDRYEEGYKTMSIPVLLNASDWFGIQTSRLAEFLADFKRDYNESYYIRKISIEQKRQHLINSCGFNSGDAGSQAIVDNKDVYMKELEAQSLAYRIEVYMKQINIIIGTIQQRVSYLKKEQRNMDNSQH